MEIIDVTTTLEQQPIQKSTVKVSIEKLCQLQPLWLQSALTRSQVTIDENGATSSRLENCDLENKKVRIN